MGPPRFVANALRFGSMYDHIGQDITGFSTQAQGSILTFIAIVLGSALTMKVQYAVLMRAAR